MKSNTIEFIGVPGAGKSSVYKELCQSWNRKENWIPLNALLYSSKNQSNRPLHWLRFKLYSSFKIKTEQSVPVNNGVLFAQKNEKLAEFYWKHLSDTSFPTNSDIGFRFRAAFFLFRDFCRYQAIIENANGIPCLMDEGILQKSFLIDNNIEKTDTILDEFFTLCALPKIVFWVHVDSVDLVIKRLSNRHKYIASHIGKDRKSLAEETRKWQKIMELIVRKIENHGVVVHQLDGTLPIKTNTEKVRNILNSLS